METLHRFYRHRMPRSIANIPRAGFVTLCAIDDHTGDSSEDMPVSQLAALHGISKASVSQTLGSLEKRGYIERRIDPRDHRVVLVRLTDEGREIIRRAQQSLCTLLEQIISTFGEIKTNALCDLMDEFCVIRQEIEDKWHNDELMEEEERCENSSAI